MSGDHGPLTCSHLQNYDPDRALTDYISRLEALQRRLGSVTSGNTSSPAHMHYMWSSYSFLRHLKFYWRKTLSSICGIYIITNLVMSAYSTVRVCPVKLRSSELTYSDCCTQSKRCEINACVKVWSVPWGLAYLLNSSSFLSPGASSYAQLHFGLRR